MQDAVIVSAVRTAVGKAPKGTLSVMRPDEMTATAIRGALARVPGLDVAAIDDVILGCAMPEGEQGLNVARIASLRAGIPVEASAVTVNRLCSSGLPAVEISMVRNEIELPRVEGDNEMIGRLAAEHFLERGFRHFAWAPFMDDVVNTERYRGFTHRLAEINLTCELLPTADSRHDNPASRDWPVKRRKLVEALV